MRRTHLGVQAVIVLAMVAFVSWPQFRPVRMQSVWRYAPAAVLEARTADAARFAGDAVRRPAGLKDATYATPIASVGSARADLSYATPTAVSILGGKLNALVGFARTSLNTPIPYARVVLRNIRTGQVLARAVANERGEFSFVDIDSNVYVVELVGADGAVVAASPMVMMARGDVQRTELRVASAASTVTTSFGDTLAPTLQQATTVAASSDVARTTTTVTAQESPR